MRSSLAEKIARLGLVLMFGGAGLAVGACGDASGNGLSTWQGGGTWTGRGAGSGGGGAGGTGGAGGGGGGGASSNGQSSGTGGMSSGSAGSSGSSGSTSPSFDVNLGAATITADLLTSQSSVVTIAPSNGFSGTVDLALTAPAGVTAKLDKTSLTVGGGAGASANLSVTSSLAGASTVTITATSGALSVEKPVQLSINKTLTLYIPADAEMNKGTTANPYNTAFGPASGIVVKGAVPLTLKIGNKDATAHIIHADGKNGFLHGDTNNPIPQGGMDAPRTLTAATTYSWYLHDQGAALVTGKLIIQ